MNGYLEEYGGMPVLKGTLSNIVEYPDFPEYEGPYTATPKTGEDLILETREKTLLENITVKKIPFSEVSNLSGGTTVYIGSEVD